MDALPRQQARSLTGCFVRALTSLPTRLSAQVPHAPSACAGSALGVAGASPVALGRSPRVAGPRRPIVPEAGSADEKEGMLTADEVTPWTCRELTGWCSRGASPVSGRSAARIHRAPVHGEDLDALVCVRIPWKHCAMGAASTLDHAAALRPNCRRN